MILFNRSQRKVSPDTNVLQEVYGKKHVFEKKSTQSTKCIALKYFECIIPSCFKRQENIGLEKPPIDEQQTTTQNKFKRELSLNNKIFNNLSNKKITKILVSSKPSIVSSNSNPVEKTENNINSEQNFNELY